MLASSFPFADIVGGVQGAAQRCGDRRGGGLDALLFLVRYDGRGERIWS